MAFLGQCHEFGTGVDSNTFGGLERRQKVSVAGADLKHTVSFGDEKTVKFDDFVVIVAIFLFPAQAVFAEAVKSLLGALKLLF